MKSRVGTMACGAPLSEMPCGCRLEVADLSGSPASRARLYALGILPGAELERCQTCDGKGSVCVRVRQSSLVLGGNLAESIVCRALEERERLPVNSEQRRVS